MPIMDRAIPLPTIKRFRRMSAMYGSALEGNAEAHSIHYPSCQSLKKQRFSLTS